jgi:hypothetical protein
MLWDGVFLGGVVAASTWTRYCGLWRTLSFVPISLGLGKSVCAREVGLCVWGGWSVGVLGGMAAGGGGGGKDVLSL